MERLVSNGDEQNSTAAISAQGATYPSSIDITQDGHFAVFGDTSTALVVEVADISSGQLTKTVPYQTPLSINSSNVFLSPDETMLYVSDTQGDRVSAVFFNQDTGQISGGCLSNLLKGYSSHSVLYRGGWRSRRPRKEDGGGVYMRLSGSPTIAMVKVTSSGGRCKYCKKRFIPPK